MVPLIGPLKPLAPCLTHWVSPDWPAIIAMAFGADGVSSVAKMLSKIVKRLGSMFSVPVEVVPFGWQATERKLNVLGANPALRSGTDGKPYVTDGGHYILDCAFGPMEDPKEIAHQLDHVVGVVEHGLFLKYASEAFIGGLAGVKVFKRKS